MTGCTVVLCEAGVVPGVDVRGGAPGTIETDLMRPGNMVNVVHAILLSGGSAFGLAAQTGVVRWLEEHGVGLEFAGQRIPIVPGADPLRPQHRRPHGASGRRRGLRGGLGGEGRPG